MTLVILAAGMGSRYGGMKQIDPITDDGNFIIDFSIYDAIKSGFNKVIFIIKEENLNDFKETIGNRINKHIDVEYAFQRISDVPDWFEIPDNRIKPWGTTHAILSVSNIVNEPFAVINADDFYGYQSFKLIADFLKSSDREDLFISAGFQAYNTLSEKGAVKRGIFTLDGEFATDLVESEVEIRDGEIWATPLNLGIWRQIELSTLVSMTMFGFTRKLVDKLVSDFEGFFNQPIEILQKAEFLLPMEVNKMLQAKEIELLVKTTEAKWYGITYKEDLEQFKQAIIDMKNKGVYPKHLY